MRRVRIVLGLGLLAVFALGFASVASAKSVVKLTVSGKEVPVGSTAYNGIVFTGSSGCLTWSQGTVAVNGAAKDKLNTATLEVEKECSAGSEVTGGLTRLEVTAKTAKATGTIVVTTGSCQYTFKNPKIHWISPPPSQAAFEGTAKGSLSNKGVGCAKKVTESVVVVGTESLRQPFTAEL